MRRGIVFGTCPICERRTFFYKTGSWLRDQFHCARCQSLPRQRALLSVLHKFFPNWRELEMHESSPGGPSSDKLLRECKRCVQSHWFEDTPVGTSKNGFRSENLERQTFADRSFDLVITQDVFEHVLRPGMAFAEVARTLKPGGAHVFTVPWFHWKSTLVRAEVEAGGAIRHVETPDYHGNPIDPNGSLVITEWGSDLCDFIYRCSGLTTTVVHEHDRSRGIDAKFIEVFISRAPQ